MYSDRRVRSDDGLRRQADKTEAEEESGVGFRDEDQQFGWCVPEIHTRWHQAWKNQFPEDWQEVVHFDENGEKHIADVKTERGWVLEFQHSRLEPGERQSRNAFYCPKLVWVVDALSRKTDLTQFEEMMNRALRLDATGFFWVASPGSCRLVNEWSGSDAQVLFDFGPKPGLWWMLGRLSNDQVLFHRYTHTQFIEAHGGIGAQKDTDFDALVKDLGMLFEDYDGLIRSRSAARSQPRLPARTRATARRRRRW
jgi:hypothetical protein